MDLGIAGRTAIVCASSKGLGLACAAALAEAGCDLVISGRSAETLDVTARDLAARFKVRVTPVAGDLGAPATRTALLAACPAPDILVNNNGGPPPKDIYAVGEDDLDAGLMANFKVPALLFQAVIVGGMKTRGFGRIINITSGSVRMPYVGLSVSSGARAGLTAFLANAVADLAPHDVTINNLLPGPFDTDRIRGPARTRAKAAGVGEDEMLAPVIATIPAGRLGRPSEFGALCAFIASAHAGFITGQNLVIDGGRYKSIF